MKTLYLAKEERHSGVSALSTGLLRCLQARHIQCGFLKPLGYLPFSLGDELTDADAHFKAEMLGLKTTPCPLVYTQELQARVMAGETVNWRGILLSAIKEIEKTRPDLLVAEGALDLRQGRILGMDGVVVAALMNAQIIVVDRFEPLLSVDRLLSAKDRAGDLLMGAFINRVPVSCLDEVSREVVPFLERQGVAVLGVIPHSDVLRSASVRLLSEALGATVLRGEERMEDLVEGFTIGAMSAEHALKFFRRRPHYAVITGGDRSAMQLAAIEAGARCLILTGNYAPSAGVLTRAEEMNIPVLLVEDDTSTAAEKAEWVVGHSRTHEPAKLDHLTSMIESHVNVDRICEWVRAPG